MKTATTSRPGDGQRNTRVAEPAPGARGLLGLTLVAVILLVACGGEGDPRASAEESPDPVPEAPGTGDESVPADSRTSTRPRADRDSGPILVPREVLGVVSRPGSDSTDAIVALAVGPEGAVYASGRQGGIMRFGPGGRSSSIRSVSPRAGTREASADGSSSSAASRPDLPGSDSPDSSWESTRPLGLAVLPDGTLVVRDPDAIRLYEARDAPEGSPSDPAQSRPAPDGRPVYGADALRVSSEGSLWAGLAPALDPDGAPLRFPRPAFGRIEIEADGSARRGVVDTLFVPERFTDECPTLSTARFRSGWFEDLRVRYVPKVKWALTPDAGLVVGCPADYRFEILPRGERADPVVVSRDHRAVGVGQDEHESFVALWTAQMNASGRHPDRWSWEDPDLPPTKPAYQKILVGEEGRIWIWRSRPSTPLPTRADWQLAGLPETIFFEPRTGSFDVFDPGGAFLGAVALPEDVQFTPFPDTPDPVIRGDTVWAVRQASGHREEVVRFEVSWEPDTSAP